MIYFFHFQPHFLHNPSYNAIIADTLVFEHFFWSMSHYFWILMWMNKQSNFQRAKGQPQCFAYKSFAYEKSVYFFVVSFIYQMQPFIGFHRRSQVFSPQLYLKKR